MRYSEVHWGVHGCEQEGCVQPGALIWEDNELLCISCADRRIERMRLVTEDRDSIRHLLPLRNDVDF